jgi:hypothetical protein
MLLLYASCVSEFWETSKLSGTLKIMYRLLPFRSRIIHIKYWMILSVTKNLVANSDIQGELSHANTERIGTKVRFKTVLIPKVGSI